MSGSVGKICLCHRVVLGYFGNVVGVYRFVCVERVMGVWLCFVVESVVEIVIVWVRVIANVVV